MRKAILVLMNASLARIAACARFSMTCGMRRRRESASILLDRKLQSLDIMDSVGMLRWGQPEKI